MAKRRKLFSLELKSENKEKGCSCFYNYEWMNIKSLFRSQRLKCFSLLYWSFCPSPTTSWLSFVSQVFSLIIFNTPYLARVWSLTHSFTYRCSLDKCLWELVTQKACASLWNLNWAVIHTDTIFISVLAVSKV